MYLTYVFGRDGRDVSMCTETFEGYINHPMQTHATSKCTSVLHLEAP